MWCILGPGYFSSIPPCWFDESGPLLVGEWFIYAHLARQGSESEAGVPLIGPPSFRAPYWPSYSFLTRAAISHPRFSIGCRISDKFTYHQAPCFYSTFHAILAHKIGPGFVGSTICWWSSFFDLLSKLIPRGQFSVATFRDPVVLKNKSNQIERNEEKEKAGRLPGRRRRDAGRQSTKR